MARSLSYFGPSSRGRANAIFRQEGRIGIEAPTHVETLDDLDELLATMEAELVVAGQPATVAGGGQVVSGKEPAANVAEQVDTLDQSLESVHLELALHSKNLISLGFEASIQAALKDIGGEMLFQMRVDREDCQRIAAVRIGSGEEQQLALGIMPPGGGLLRVEPVEQSSNPFAPITESYAILMDMLRAC